MENTARTEEWLSLITWDVNGPECLICDEYDVQDNWGCFTAKVGTAIPTQYTYHPETHKRSKHLGATSKF
jgi:hypothetical protein